MLRFSWEQVVGAPGAVADVVRRAVALVDTRGAAHSDLRIVAPHGATTR